MSKNRYILILYIALICLVIFTFGTINHSKKIAREKELIFISDMYISILQNKTSFVYEGESIYWQDFLNEYLYSYSYWAPVCVFRLADMNGDGTAELILELHYTMKQLILHYNDGVVYGYYRHYGGSLDTLKEDGTFISSSMVSRMNFLENYCEIIYISKIYIYDSYHLYYIDTNRVTLDEYREFIAEQEKKENAKRYKLSESFTLSGAAPTDELIREEFSAAWEKWMQER